MYNIFNIFKRKKQDIPKQDTGEKEFIFIWYKKMVNGSKNHYTQPFRTRVWANNKEEAKIKLENFAINKMTLVSFEEKDLNSSDLMKFQNEYSKLNKMFQEELNNLFSKK